MNLGLDPLLLIPLAVVIFLMALPHLRRRMMGKVNFVKTYEFYRQLEAGSKAVIIDVRKEKDFVHRHILEAVNIPMAEFEDRLSSDDERLQAYKNHPLVLICQSDLDSIRAARKLGDHGFTDVTVIKGGMFRWGLDRLPTERKS